MSDTPANPFANLTAPPTGVSPVGGGMDTKRAKVNRFTPLEFTGTAGQLFGIQMVNLFLTIITLGIWTPWARVRRRRFFYNNTQIFGEGIDYTAKGFTLFKGWAIVSVFVICYYNVSFLSIPFAQEALTGVFFLAYPWVINRSLRFNAQNTAWRDVRFVFTGSYFGSMWYLFVLPAIGVASLGLLLPLASKLMREYIARNYSFGTAAFTSKASVSAYYGAGIKSLLLFIVLTALLLGIFYSYITLQHSLDVVLVIKTLITQGTAPIENVAGMILSLFPFILLALFFVSTTFYHALTRNIMVGALRLDGGVRFRSNIASSIFAWITISNAVLAILSLGLLWPWAQVRRYRYMTESTEIRPINDLKGFVDKERAAGNSLGDAFGEAGGIDVQF